ncbi:MULTISPECIES: ABC transporter ATP-binding protein [Rothia]|jgi:lipid A export ATP-binding/permease protein msbA|uniref:ABC transporter ATP-binding protein n=1 Tax=Rothia TaxID=32207 RepID=UPI00066A7DB4|nr:MULTISPECIES: ABC transporter ATP-binding protein [Rothia]MBS4946137.1 ABC transporter ATP-binding protein [Rothia mucilaginosa]OFM98783.1 ABC transporter permease [Rothia sp. HMSC072B03]OHP74276.1 ABC transporter permease [Rothia sp. HMSC062F03]
MSEASTTHTGKQRRNPFLETAPEPIPAPIDYAHGQHAPRTLAAYARPIRLRWSVGLLVAFGAGVLEISIPQVLQMIVDHLSHSATESAIWAAGGLVLVLAIAHASFAYWRRWLLVDPTSTIEMSMRMNFFDRLLSAPIALLDRWPSGQLLTRSMSDLGTIRRWLSFGIVQLLTVIVMFLGGAFYMLQSSPLLALVFVVTVPVLVLSLVNFTRKYYRVSHEIQQLTGDLSTRIEESVRGIRVIKALGRSPEQIRGYAQAVDALQEREYGRSMLVARVALNQTLIVGISTAVALALGASQVANGALSLGAMTAYFAVQTTVLSHVIRSTSLMSAYLSYKVALERHNEVMDEPGFEVVRLIDPAKADEYSPNPANAQDSAQRSSLSSHPSDASGAARSGKESMQYPSGGAVSVAFNQVSFSYEESAPAPNPAADSSLGVQLPRADVLHDVTFKAFPGEILALVGATGSGKSTVLSLVPRFYEPTSGSLRLGSHDMADLSVEQVRAQTAFVFEEAVLFSGSVRENVLMGVADQYEGGTSDEDYPGSDELEATLNTALKLAACEFAYELPQGLDTIIGEEGLSLSGGQRQRLSLARALAKRPSVLLLDDPFSALDVDTEERIINGLREGLEGLGGATTLLTAHRPSTVALADRVLLMVDGTITAEGTHAELMESSEQYRRLMTMEEG